MITYPFNINDTFYLHKNYYKFENDKFENDFEREYEVIVTYKDIPNDEISFNFTMIKDHEKLMPLNMRYSITHFNYLINITHFNYLININHCKISNYKNNSNLLDEELFKIK